MQPLIGICGSRVVDDGVEYDSVRCRYVQAVRGGIGGIPVVIPLFAYREDEATALLAGLDGLVLAGSQSNIEPARYGGNGSTAPTDPVRDDAALNLIPLAIRLGVPLLGICRGMQELNVALGGDLHQDISAVDELLDHREDLSQPRDRQYLPAHGISVVGPILRNIAGKKLRNGLAVNSLHNQGIRALASGLIPEATAPDGLIEAVSLSDAPAFSFAVQWHPEWFFDSDHLSSAIFATFGDACRARSTSKSFISSEAALEFNGPERGPLWVSNAGGRQ